MNMIRQIATFAMALLALSACGAQKPMLASNAYLVSVGSTVAERDIDECIACAQAGSEAGQTNKENQKDTPIADAPTSSLAGVSAGGIVFAWDGAVPAFAQEMLRAGKLPNLAKLIEGGAFSYDVEPVFPSETAPGFASLITGAPPRVTGISGNRVPRAPREQFTVLESRRFCRGAAAGRADLGRRPPGGKKIGGRAYPAIRRRTRSRHRTLFRIRVDRWPGRHSH
jgi:hypothetical protein